MFIGHRIGHNEANLNRPAIGVASQQGFKLILEELCGIQTSAESARELMLQISYVTNATRCDPRQDAPINTTNTRTCINSWLTYEIPLVDPVIIVFWNTNVARILTGLKTVPHGEVFEASIRGKQYSCLVMTHPVSVVHDPAYQPVIRSQVQILRKFLVQQGFYLKLDNQDEEVEHRLVLTKKELLEAVKDLEDSVWLGLDTETGLIGDQNIPDGGLLWWHPDFRVITVQLCGLKDGKIKRSYTIACGFVDSYTRLPVQELTHQDVREALEQLLQKPRKIAIFNANFDVPVLLRMGVNLLSGDYPCEIYDPSILAVRHNEHLDDLKQLSLDNLSKIYLGESKSGGFLTHFSPQEFPYLCIQDPSVQKRVTDYAGNDPVLTLKLALRLIDLLIEQSAELNLPQDEFTFAGYGFRPYPLPGTNPYPHILNVACAIDHQMIPIICEMEMVGYEFNADMAQIKSSVDLYLNKILSEIHSIVPGLQPYQTERVLDLVDNLFERFAESLSTLPILDVHKIVGAPIDSVSRKTLKEAYMSLSGDINAQQDTIKNKIFTFFDTVNEKLTDAGYGKVDFEDTRKVLNLVFLYKQLHKKYSTYFLRFAKQLENNPPGEKILHPSYKQTTLSGRFNGDLMNLPRGGKADIEWLELLIQATFPDQLPEEEKERLTFLNSRNIFDVRQFLRAPSAAELSSILRRMNITQHNLADEPYVFVSADFAAQEDRMAFALSGDATKAKLLADSTIDTHYYNVAFCFGSKHGFDTSTEEGLRQAYEYFVSNDHIYKQRYRTPTKTFHFAAQYGAAAPKLHQEIGPIFAKHGIKWNLQDTIDLKEKYDLLYWGVTQLRQELADVLRKQTYLVYPLFGAVRHALTHRGEVVSSEYLSCMNAYNQGTCAYVNKLAMLRMRHLIHANAPRWQLLQAGGNRFVGFAQQVHDEIVMLCPASIAVEVGQALESAMKMICGPVQPGKPLCFYDTNIKDRRGQSGWMYFASPKFRGVVLFDADAEIKLTLAKAKELHTGETNILATFDKPDSLTSFSKSYPPNVRDEYPLLTYRNPVSS